MSYTSERAAVDDLEDMLKRGLNIDASPPRWSSTYGTSQSHVDNSSVHIPGTPYYPQKQIPINTGPAMGSAHNTTSPTAIYNPAYRTETQAIPSTPVPTGMRASASLQSLGSISTSPESQHIAQLQASQAHTAQRLRRLEQLQYEQELQERELQALKRREQELASQHFREQQLREQQIHEQQIREQQIREQQQADEAQYRLQQEREQQIMLEKQREADRIREEEAQALAQAIVDSEREHFVQQQQRQLYEQQRHVAEQNGASQGAATMLQRTQDKDGKVTTRVVKKGVEDFEFKEELGAGSYSTVVAAQDKQTLRQYAIKILDKAHIIKEQKVKYVEIEKLTLNRLGNHPGIIRLYFTFQDRQSLYFVLDFAPNGELLNLIKRIGSLNEECSKYYAAQLLDAIDYMHKKGVIHRDLKPENILLDYKMRIKITDFGTAKLLDANPETGEYPVDTRCSSFVGTAEYVSPELLVGKSQGKSTDIWAWGCVLYQMIAASPPFQGNTQFLTFQKIAKIQYSIPPGFPYVVRELLQHVLVKPQIRYTIEEIKEHEFFNNQDWSVKGVWGAPPPRLQPYKASVASMKPRPLASATGSKNTRVVVPSRVPPSRGNTAAVLPNPSASVAAANVVSNKQVFVPTSSGLQSLNPNTMYGMPVYQRDDNANSMRNSPSVGSKLGTGVSAKSNKRQPSSKPVHSSAYQQSQEKIEALRRRMQEQRQASRSPSSGSSAVSPTVTSSSSASITNSPRQIARSPSHGRLNQQTAIQRPITPKEQATSPNLGYDSPLPQQPITQLESQYSNILVSAQERILKVGTMDVFVSNHAPAQTTMKPKLKPKLSPSNPALNAASTAVDDHINDEEPGEELVAITDDSLFSKLRHTKMKKRLVIITTYGRLLVLTADDRRVQYEVPLGLPQVVVKEVPFQVGSGSKATKTNKIVVQTYNKVLTLDERGGDNSVWLAIVELSRRYYAQVLADQERNSFNAAAAAASAVAGRRR